MEIKVEVEFEQLLTIIKELPDAIRFKLKNELDSGTNSSLKKNLWKEYFEYLSELEKRKLRDKIINVLSFTTATFYRKLKSEKNSFSISDKLTIAKLANLPPHFLFPELE